MIKKLPIYIFALFLIPSVVWGASIVRTGEMISIAPDQVVEDDFYGMGNSVVVSGSVAGDLLVTGGELTVNGKIGKDLAVLAGQVDVHGNIGDDARIVAGEVTIAGEVNGDLVVIAQNLKVLSTAKINGDILFFGNNADISGVIGGDILGANEKMRLDAEVAGGVDVSTTNLVLGDNSKIGDNVKYTSASELTRAQNSQVTNDIVRSDPVYKEDNQVKSFLIVFLITLFASLVWYLFFRKLLQKIVLHTSEHVMRNFFVGFGIFFLLPIASLILLASTLGSLLGMFLLFSYALLILASFITAGVVAGSFLGKLYSSSANLSILFIVLGVFALIGLIYIPVIGPILLTILLLLTLGSVATTLYRLLRSN
jgi:cytoskeletal protein CcmA (bactofilin family)